MKKIILILTILYSLFSLNNVFANEYSVATGFPTPVTTLQKLTTSLSNSGGSLGKMIGGYYVTTSCASNPYSPSINIYTNDGTFTGSYSHGKGGGCASLLDTIYTSEFNYYIFSESNYYGPAYYLLVFDKYGITGKDIYIERISHYMVDGGYTDYSYDGFYFISGKPVFHTGDGLYWSFGGVETIYNIFNSTGGLAINSNLNTPSGNNFFGVGNNVYYYAGDGFHVTSFAQIQSGGQDTLARNDGYIEGNVETNGIFSGTRLFTQNILPYVNMAGNTFISAVNTDTKDNWFVVYNSGTFYENSSWDGKYMFDYDFSSNNGLIITDYGTGSNQINYQFSKGKPMLLGQYDPYASKTYITYFKDGDNTLYTNFNGINGGNQSDLPITGPNGENLSGSGSNNTNSGSSNTSSGTSDNSSLLGSIGDKISSGFSSLTGKLESLFGANGESLSGTNFSGVSSINGSAISSMDVTGSGAISTNFGQLSPIVTGDSGIGSCEMFGDNLQFLYRSTSYSTFNFSFGDYDNYFLDSLSFLGNKTIGVFLAPIQNTVSIIYILTPFHDNSQYCILGSIMDFKTHLVWQHTPYYQKMTIIDYLALFAFGFIMLSSLLAIHGVIVLPPPPEQVRGYTENAVNITKGNDGKISRSESTRVVTRTPHKR